MSVAQTNPRKHTDLIRNLPQHAKYLNEVVPGGNARYFDLEWNFIEQTSVRPQYLLPCTVAQKPINEDKNRYPDVLPPDNNRVTLKEISGCAGSDFINANFVMGSNGDAKAYIVTQAPLENTVVDFWRMCWEHGVNLFVMLTKEVEKGQEKSAKYWPDENDPDKTVKYGNFEVKLADSQVESEDLLIRTLKIKNLDEQDSPERSMIHFQYIGWPDHGVPPSTNHFTQLAEQVDETIKAVGGPIGIHCSAGIGRTGTFCCVHINIHILREHFKTSPNPPPLNIVNTILHLRKQRPGMVQTKEQFLFCYNAILEEYVRLWQEARKKQAEAAEVKSQPPTEVKSQPPTEVKSQPPTEDVNKITSGIASLSTDDTQKKEEK